MSRQPDCARCGTLVEREIMGEPPLSADERRFVTEHRARCEGCGVEGAVLGLLDDALEQTWAPPAGGEDLQETAHRLAQQAGARRPREALRRSAAWGFLAAAAAAGLVVAILHRDLLFPRLREPGPGPPGEPTARLGLSSGAVQLDGRSASAGTRVMPGAALEVAEGAAVLLLDQRHAVLVEAHSRLRLDRAGRSEWRLRLDQGRASLSIAPLRGQRLGVDTPAGSVEVVGTLLSVASSPSELRVAVARGQVTVHRRDGPTLGLKAGQVWDSRQGASGLAVPERQGLLSWSRLAERLLSPGAALLEVETQPTGADVWLRGSRIGRTPL
jgi:hypothetical protein